MAENPLEAFRQTERLCRNNEKAIESRIALAEAALAADIWGEARRHLMACVNDRTATQGVYKMLARLERRERHDEGAATMWLTKASEAAPDPVWLCRVCGGAHENWNPICKPCGSFDSMEWQSAGKSRGALPYRKDLLLMIDADDLEPPQKAKPKLRDLQPMSIGELEEYIASMEEEIARADAMIAKKKAHKSGIESLFGKRRIEEHGDDHSS